MPINRITVFENYGRSRSKTRGKAKSRARKTPIQKLFGDCSVSCRRDAPGRGEYGPCLSVCLRGGKKPARRRAR